MRARWLGSAGLTVLVGCGCGARLYLTLARWARRGFAVCDRCGAAIVYASLEVIEAKDVEGYVEKIINQEQERESLRGDVERELRRFVQLYDRQPEWLWSPVTVKLVQAVRPKLELLGGPIPAAAPARGGYLTTEAAFQGVDYDDLLDDLADEEEERAAPEG